jgi:hypothetical protein
MHSPSVTGEFEAWLASARLASLGAASHSVCSQTVLPVRRSSARSMYLWMRAGSVAAGPEAAGELAGAGSVGCDSARRSVGTAV